MFHQFFVLMRLKSDASVGITVWCVLSGICLVFATGKAYGVIQ